MICILTIFMFTFLNLLPRYLEDLYTLTYQEDSFDRDEEEDPEIPAWGASRCELFCVGSYVSSTGHL